MSYANLFKLLFHEKYIFFLNIFFVFRNEGHVEEHTHSVFKKSLNFRNKKNGFKFGYCVQFPTSL